MPRAPSNNTVSVTIKMPQAWVDFAGGIADVSNEDALDHRDLRLAAKLTRTDVMRMALEDGLKRLSGGVDPNEAVDWAREVAEIRRQRAQRQKNKKGDVRRLLGRRGKRSLSK